MTADKHYKVHVILIGAIYVRDKFFKKVHICTQSEFIVFSYGNLEQVKSEQDRLVSLIDSTGLILYFQRKFREVGKLFALGAPFNL